MIKSEALQRFEFELRRRGFLGNKTKGYSDGMHRLIVNDTFSSWKLIGSSGFPLEEGSMNNLPMLFGVLDHYRMQ